MTSIQLCFGLLIFLFMIIKPIAYKPCIQYFPSKVSANFTSVWLLIGIIFSWPFLGHLFTDNWRDICSSPYILFSILKGILLYAMLICQQEVNKNMEIIRGSLRPHLSLKGPKISCPNAKPSIEKVKPICTIETLVLKKTCMEGKLGKYISVTNGPKAVNIPKKTKIN